MGYHVVFIAVGPQDGEQVIVQTTVTSQNKAAAEAVAGYLRTMTWGQDEYKWSISPLNIFPVEDGEKSGFVR